MLSIVIAAYNEEKRIASSLEKIRLFMSSRAIDYEVIVVDDGSTDATGHKVLGFKSAIPRLDLISYRVNRGKGYALRMGVLASRGDYVLLSDADLSTPIEELDKMMPLITGGQGEVIIGSRALALSEIIKKQPWWRRGMGRIFNRFVRLLVLDDFGDTQCGFKLFSGWIARELFAEAKIDRFAFDVEILALAKKRGYRIFDIPIRWVNAPGSKVNPILDSPQMLFDLCRIRLRIGSLKSSDRDRSLAPVPEIATLYRSPLAYGKAPSRRPLQIK